MKKNDKGQQPVLDILYVHFNNIMTRKGHDTKTKV